MDLEQEPTGTGSSTYSNKEQRPGAFKRKESEVLFKDLDTRHYNVDLVQGIGPKKAIELVKKHKSIEEILAHLDKTKYPPPENWMYNEAR